MAYRGGGGGGRGGGDQDQRYGRERGDPAGGRGDGRARTGWPPPGPPSSASRPATPAITIYNNPNATGPHQAVVFRNPAPPPYALSPSAGRASSSTLVTMGAPCPTPDTIRAPPPTPTPAAAPFQPARVSAPAPAPALPLHYAPSPSTVRASSSTPVTICASPPTPSPAAAQPFQPPPAPAPPSPTPSTAAVAKDLELNLFVTETALAPAVATQVGQPVAEKAPEVDAPVFKIGLAHPARPSAGTVGKEFLVSVADNNLFHYDVSINQESNSRAVNREVLSELIKLHGTLGGKLPAYDGRKSLYAAGSLPFESEELAVTLVDLQKKDKERAEREYKITIKVAGRTDLYHFQQFMKGRQRDMPQETIQVLDVALRESPSWNYVTVSRSFFSTTFDQRGDIGEGLECWRGYYQSLRQTQMGFSLNIGTPLPCLSLLLLSDCSVSTLIYLMICISYSDISATSFFKPVKVVQFVLEFLNLSDASRPPTDRNLVKLRCHDYGKEKTCALSIGQWNMINKKMVNGGTTDNCRELPAYDGRESLCTADSLPSESEEFSGTLIDPEMKDNERAEWEFKMITQKIINGGTIDNLENGAPFVSEVPTVIVTAPVVASMDKPETSKYGGLASAQPYMQEVLEDLFNSSKDSQKVTANGGKMNELLITFRRKTGRRPQRVVFRDGVSEDQFCEVLFHKTDRIRKAHASFENEHILPVNFVVDQKKHNTKLFPKVHVRHGSLNNVSSTNGGVIPQEEPLEAHHPPNLDSIIQFFVDINGRRVSVQRTPEADLGSAIAEAMLKTNCYIPDFYVGYEQHVLDLDRSILSQKIGQNSTVKVQPRVRGGVETIDMSFKGIRFEDRIKSFSHDDLFEERTVIPELMGKIRRIRRGRTRAGTEHIMRTLGRCTMHKLFEMLHLLHLRGISLNGNFTHENVIYLPLLDSYVINENHVKSNHADYTPLGYEHDMRALGRVLKQLFTWKFPRSIAGVFPVHVDHLLQTLNAMPVGASTSDAFKAYLRNHVSMLSPGAVEGLILEVHRYIRYQAENLQESTKMILGPHVMHPSNLPSWTNVAQLVDCFKEVYSFQSSYSEDKISWFDFLRNFLTHPNKTKPPTFTIEEVDLAFAYHFDEALPRFLCDLVMGHTFISSHTVESVFSRDWFNTKVFVVDAEIASTSGI
ncbi:protein argonaute MEL1 isoform X3 [Triticum aestivum]|uniref:protein argonaute MEL1 isoform X3 n=1 Tax=Triticum aestivum TaxID=4565 RepID=UPI001D02369A|nr:protein argonaute MEL1-like isoform X3 [Triticum aestivum]